MPRRKPNTGSVVVRADGRIAVVLPKDLDPARRPIYSPGNRVPFASVEQATAWLDAEIEHRRNPPLAHVTDRHTTLGIYLTRWYDRGVGEWPARTASAYKAALLHWGALERVPLGELTRERIRDAVAARRRATWQHTKKDGTPVGEPRTYAARTIRQALMVLAAALEELVPEVLASNPARQRRRGRQPPAPEQPVWSGEQADQFLAVATRMVPDLELVFRLILKRALRIGEAVSVRRSDLDQQRSVLTVARTAALRGEHTGDTKTRRTRDIPLSAELVTRIQAYMREHPTTRPWLFVRQGRRLSVPIARDAWVRVALAAHLPPISPKDGRATCATNLLDSGIPLPVVSQLLGHTNIATTSTFYARVLKRRSDQIAALGETLDAALGTAITAGTTHDG